MHDPCFQTNLHDSKLISKFKNTRGFKIAKLNIRSLIENIDQFRYFLKDKQFDIICLNETLLDDTINDHEVNITGYQILRNDRNRNGGGLAVSVRNTIYYISRTELDTNDLETITVEISKPRSKPFIVNCMHRPPNSTVELFSAYEKLIEKLDSENKETILIGDFNCDWTGVKSGTMKSQTNKLHEITEAFQFKQMIELPTRITEHSESIIDLVFRNKPELVTYFGVIHVGISGHSLIFLQRKISVPRSEPKLIKKGILNIIM